MPKLAIRKIGRELLCSYLCRYDTIETQSLCGGGTMLKFLDLEHETCLRFVEQFEPGDQPMIKAMISNIRLVDGKAFNEFVHRVIKEVSESDEGPLAVLMCRQLDSDEDDPFCYAGSDPGSEGRIAHIVKNYVKTYDWNEHANSNNPVVLCAPDIEEMRENRVRRLLILSDIVGSGTELVNYVQAVFSNTTIKSWVSFGSIKQLYVRTYAMLEKGFDCWSEFVKNPPGCKKLMKASDLLSIEQICEYLCPPITQHDDYDQEHLRDLLKKVKKQKIKFCRIPPLGYSKSEGSVVFAPNMPNNLPPIFWYKTRTWKPLFDGRLLVDESPFQSNQSHERQLNERRFQLEQNEFLILNELVNTGSRNLIARKLRLNWYALNSSLDDFYRRGLILEDGRLTETGVCALEHYREADGQNQHDDWPLDKVYIPKK